MKTLIIGVYCLLGFTLLANNMDNLRLQPLEYNIVSDVKDKKIKKGKFVIEGTIKMFSSANPLEGASVGVLGAKKSVKSDKEGHFSIELNCLDSIAIHFYKKGWSEVVIEDYTFESRHRVNVDVYLVKDRQDVKRKPVIYLYNEENLNVSINLDPKGEFIFTYPEYKDGWNVTVKPEGGIESEGINYPYLFWEAKSEALSINTGINEIEGFVIESANCIVFFEEVLAEIGLNQQEKADFITYWGPILQAEKYAFIQFVIDENYQKDIAEMEIIPAPNSSKRVFMLYSPLTKPFAAQLVVPQQFASFEREGFVLIEWGGAIIESLDPSISDLHK